MACLASAGAGEKATPASYNGRRRRGQEPRKNMEWTEMGLLRPVGSCPTAWGSRPGYGWPELSGRAGVRRCSGGP